MQPDYDKAVICAVNVLALVESLAEIRTSLTSTPKGCHRDELRCFLAKKLSLNG
jgi:hypothetical protein